MLRSQVFAQYWYEDLDVLGKLPTDAVRALWDEYDGSNSPLGISGEAIHFTLNMRGDGAYCAV